ncbi:HAD family hydrolase [Thalassovita aquimarina]|uniref:HAD family phosphatase n=1 Tax=Thalassovita aquimarina TaxID=2785917 RepID=A0ABS5HU35_9RHOB|nr:HAD family phosphatase [Thalassovita aquimarina]MBR9652409.1 HAD family phosphatase [Thalassovita aquimarina]
MPKAVVFDIGRVLIEYDPEGFYDGVIGPERRKALFDAVDLHGLNLRVDAGERLHETFAEAACRHPEFGNEIALWADRWIEMASPEIPHSVRLLMALKAKGVLVLALSNFGAETFEIARAHYPFLDLFDQRYVSAHLKAIKPGPGIYAALEQGSGFAPGELLFTDDKAENIEAARQRGWRVHLFEHPQGWADCLVEHGILNEEEAA